MLNHITIMGRLTSDPEKRYTQSQKPVTSFRLAVERDFDKDRKADFINCVAWNNTADFVSKYFCKGNMIIVSGRLQMRDWTDKDGKKHTESEVIAENIYFGEAKKKETENKTAFEPLPETDGELPF